MSSIYLDNSYIPDDKRRTIALNTWGAHPPPQEELERLFILAGHELQCWAARREHFETTQTTIDAQAAKISGLAGDLSKKLNELDAAVLEDISVRFRELPLLQRIPQKAWRMNVTRLLDNYRPPYGVPIQARALMGFNELLKTLKDASDEVQSKKPNKTGANTWPAKALVYVLARAWYQSLGKCPTKSKKAQFWRFCKAIFENCADNSQDKKLKISAGTFTEAVEKFNNKNNCPSKPTNPN